MKKVVAMVLAVMMVLALFAGCTGGNTASQPTTTSGDTTQATTEAATTQAAGPIEITIPTYKCGQNVGGKFFMPQVERFNKKYEGKYKITLEEVPNDAYNEKIKQLEQQNMLPALVEGGEKEWFEKVIIANNKYYDLSSWLDSKAEMKATMIPDSVSYSTKGGKVVSLPLVKVFPIGLYYNSTMMTPSKPVGQMTFDELQAAMGSNKMALMTGENAWTTQLLLTSLVIKNGGASLLVKGATEARITDFSDPIWEKSLTELQVYLKKYASSNMLGAAYADAANNFMSKKSAVICNGPWMAGDFAPEAKDKWSNGFTGDQVKADVYPGNIAIGMPQQYWWWIPAGTPKDKVEAAEAFMEFVASPAETEAWMLAEGGIAPNLKVSDAFKTELAKNRILSELAGAFNDKTVIAPSFADAAHPSVGDTGGAFPKLLPKLVDGSMTPKQMIDEFNKAAKAATAQ